MNLLSNSILRSILKLLRKITQMQMQFNLKIQGYFYT